MHAANLSLFMNLFQPHMARTGHSLTRNFALCLHNVRISCIQDSLSLHIVDRVWVSGAFLHYRWFSNQIELFSDYIILCFTLWVQFGFPEHAFVPRFAYFNPVIDVSTPERVAGRPESSLQILIGCLISVDKVMVIPCQSKYENTKLNKTSLVNWLLTPKEYISKIML